MTKYLVDARSGSRLDYCARCEDVWLDGGEWEAVHGLARCGDFTRIFTLPWQRRVQAARSAHRQEEQLSALLGNDHDRLLEFDAWLEGHPSRDRILAFLHRRD